MGNQLAQPQKLQAEHLAEVPKVVLKDNLGALEDDFRCSIMLHWCSYNKAFCAGAQAEGAF